jgi:hypothetical protein
MWRTEDGERVLTDAELAVFVCGLYWLCETIDPDPSDEREPGFVVNRETGFGTFDRLTLGQQLVLLAEVATALSDPLVSLPHTTKYHEAAVLAAMQEFFGFLELEISIISSVVTGSRRALLAAARSDSERMPEPTDTDVEVWHRLYDRMLERLAWDNGIAIPDNWLEMPDDERSEWMRLAGYDGKTYHAPPPEPTEDQIETARATLKNFVQTHFSLETGWLSPAEISRVEQVEWKHGTQAAEDGEVESWQVEKDGFVAVIFSGPGCVEVRPGYPYFWVVVPPEAEDLRGRVAEGLASSLLVAKKRAMDALIRCVEKAQLPSSSK